MTAALQLLQLVDERIAGNGRHHDDGSAVDQMSAFLEKALKIDNIYSPENFRLTRYMEAALKAHILYHRDREYVIYLRGIEIARWELRRDCLLAISSNTDAPELPGQDTREPAFDDVAGVVFIKVDADSEDPRRAFIPRDGLEWRRLRRPRDSERRMESPV